MSSQSISQHAKIICFTPSFPFSNYVLSDLPMPSSARVCAVTPSLYLSELLTHMRALNRSPLIRL